MSAQKEKFDYFNSPTAWFCMLETARKKEDYERAAEAKKELKRLGVSVRYRDKAEPTDNETQQGVTSFQKTLATLRQAGLFVNRGAAI